MRLDWISLEELGSDRDEVAEFDGRTMQWTFMHAGTTATLQSWPNQFPVRPSIKTRSFQVHLS